MLVKVIIIIMFVVKEDFANWPSYFEGKDISSSNSSIDYFDTYLHFRSIVIRVKFGSNYFDPACSNYNICHIFK
jgi:hypothetical protein